VPHAAGFEKYTVKVDAGVTVIVEVAVLFPSAVVTVMVAVPVDTPVTTPVVLLTVATALLFELQLTV
jgi:hypothetical protein